MKKHISAMAVISILCLGLLVTASHAQTKGWNIYEVKQLLNFSVKNHQGEYLGRMQDFIVDSSGRIIFAVVSKPGFLGIRGESVAVPYDALSFGTGKNELVIDASREKFASAPNFDLKARTENGAWAAEVYRYFGVQPYWTE